MHVSFLPEEPICMLTVFTINKILENVLYMHRHFEFPGCQMQHFVSVKSPFNPFFKGPVLC